MRLTLENLCVARGPVPLLQGLSLDFSAGSICVLAGPNGAGKSSLMACIAGDLAPASGRLLVDGQAVAGRPLAQWARMRAMLRQQSEIAFGFAVRDVVAMGLHPHGIGPATAKGRGLVDQALADLDLAPMAGRAATELSGGETQRVHIARVLVQARAALLAGDGVLLLLDEPTTGLDYRHQLALLRVVGEVARAGATVLCSLHDLPLALRLADRLLLLGHGRVVADLVPDALDAPTIAELYGIAATDARLLLPGRRPAPGQVARAA